MLNGASITSSSSYPFYINDTADVTLDLAGTNTLTATGTGSRAGLTVVGTSTLTIQSTTGSGLLNATGNNGVAGTTPTGTTTTITGIGYAGNNGGAGISGGTVIILSGTVTAKGGTGGNGGRGASHTGSHGSSGGKGGVGGAGLDGMVTIEGGTVNGTGGTGGTGGAGGAGYAGNGNERGGSGGMGGTGGAGIGGTITIVDGDVMATGGNYGSGGTYASGPGGSGVSGTAGYGGSGVDGTSFTSTSGNVTAQGGTGSYGGRGISSDDVDISGGTIEATGAISGAGIGGGTGAANPGSNITITGGTVTATGGSNAAGIGGSRSGGTYPSHCGTINISGGTVTANGGTNAPGIGAGYSATTNGTITITGGRITAKGGSTTVPGIGSWSKTSNIGTVIFTGGSIHPTDSAGTVSVNPSPTNGAVYGAPDIVYMIIFGGYSDGDAFSIMAGGTVSSYPYKAIVHPDGNVYAWLTYPGASTDAATATTTEASVTAPSTVNLAASSAATLNGKYYLNNTYSVTRAYFEWGTTTTYGTTIDMTSSINTSETATAVRTLSSPALTGLTPGTVYHCRLVIETGPSGAIVVGGNDVTFTTPALIPSVDVTHDYPGGTTATLEGIYALNGGTFTNGEFELSSDNGANWSTPMGGTLTSSTTTPTVTLTGLIPGTTYHYRLTVINSEGTTTTVMKELTVSAKNLTISNTITGPYADLTKAFTFTVYFEDSSGTSLPVGTTYNYTGGIIAGSGATAPANGTLMLDSAGKATIPLTTGQTIIIAGVSTSGKVQIAETTDANYTVTFKDSLDTGSTSGSDTGVRPMTTVDRRFDFTNARKTVVPAGAATGGNTLIWLPLMALLAVMAGLGIKAVHRRRVRRC